MTDATDKQIKFAKSLGIENAEQFSKQALREMIDKKLVDKPKQEKPAEKPKIQSYDTTSYYVAYAKDILVAMISLGNTPDGKQEITALMKDCIDAVKMARTELQ